MVCARTPGLVGCHNMAACNVGLHRVAAIHKHQTSKEQQRQMSPDNRPIWVQYELYQPTQLLACQMITSIRHWLVAGVHVGPMCSTYVWQATRHGTLIN